MTEVRVIRRGKWKGGQGWKRGGGERTQEATDRDGKDEDEGIVVKSLTWEFQEIRASVGRAGVWINVGLISFLVSSLQSVAG